MLALTGRTTRGERLVHLINPTGYPATVRIDADDPTGVLGTPLTVPARSGHVLGLGLRLPGGGTLVAANAELRDLRHDRLVFGPELAIATVPAG